MGSEMCIRDSISPKAKRKYRKVPSETRSLASSEASQRKTSSEVNRTLFDKANGSTSLKVHATSFGATRLTMKYLMRPATSVMAQGQQNGGDQFRCYTSLWAEQTQFARGSQQLLRAKQIANHRRKRRARRQQAEAEDNVVCTKRDTRDQPRVFASKCDACV